MQDTSKVNNTEDSNTNETADVADAEDLSNTRSNYENQCDDEGRESIFENYYIVLHIAHDEYN